MRFLRIFGLIILSIILFLSLGAFSVSFLLNRTALNPDFVTAEVNRLEIAPLASEAMAQQLSEELPEEIIDSLTETITRLEPRLKDELNTIIYSVYDYLHGEREDPELANLLRRTLLSSDFIVAVVDETDMPWLARTLLEEFEEQLAAELPLPEEAFSLLAAGIEELLIAREPWIKEQIKYAADPIADYLVGEIESFSITISIEPLMDDLKGIVLEVFLAVPPPPLEGLPPEELEKAFDEFWDEMSAELLPTTFEIDETVIGRDMPLQIASAISEAEIVLGQAREYVGYLRLAYILSIVISALLIAGIVLIYREVKGSTRTLGIVFLVSGIMVLAVALIGKNVAGQQILQIMHDVPAQLRVWASQFVINFLSPLQWLGIGFIIGSIVLLVVSFVYRPRQTTE